jgi:hypothetical protein
VGVTPTAFRATEERRSDAVNLVGEGLEKIPSVVAEQD